jgi:hypothetical protein
MTSAMRHAIALSLTLALFGCGNDSPDSSTSPTDDEPGGSELPPGPGEEPADRPEMSVEACEGAGGTVVGDIGDGAVHRPEYRCADGQEPMGRVPSGIEGAVCCPAVQCPEGGAQPEPGPDDIPKNCAVLFEGCCFAQESDACRAAGCSGGCSILESYPGQFGGCE